MNIYEAFYVLRLEDGKIHIETCYTFEDSALSHINFMEHLDGSCKWIIFKIRYSKKVDNILYNYVYEKR